MLIIPLNLDSVLLFLHNSKLAHWILRFDAPLPRLCEEKTRETTQALKTSLFVSMYVYLLKSNEEIPYLNGSNTHPPSNG